MRLILLFCTLLAISCIGSDQASVVRNLIPAFITYWDEVKSQPVEKQAKDFKRLIVPGNPAFYEDRFKKWDKQGKDVDLELKKELQKFSMYEKKFRLVADRLGSQLSEGMTTFKVKFPDFQGATPIYLLHSLGEMDGGTRKLNGQLQLIFGVDGITQFQNTDNQLPFFHHELFHIYHAEKGAQGDLFYHALWSEGLATYVSEIMNPGSSMRDILLDLPTGLVGRCEKEEKRLWADMMTKLESKKEADYNNYFLLENHHPWIPERAGYYFGYRIAKNVSNRMPLEKMITLSGKKLLSEIKLTMTTLNAI